MKKKAIFIGEPITDLFGIKSRRLTLVQGNKYYNEYWVESDKTEKPKNEMVVENGCYW